MSYRELSNFFLYNIQYPRLKHPVHSSNISSTYPINLER